MTKKKKLILHIGMHKTGSSSIQDTLHYNLKDPNIKYMDLGTPNHSGTLNQLFSNDTNSKIRERIHSKFMSNLITNHEAYIISAEDLSMFSEDSLKSAKLFFKEFFQDVLVIGYVREPKGWIESAYQQILKDHKNYRAINTVMPNYKNKFDKFDKIFQKDNVFLYKFDPNHFPNGDVVLDFYNKIGLLTGRNIKSNEIVKTNETLSKEAVALLYLLRKYHDSSEVGRDYSKEKVSFIEALSKVGNSKFKISPAFFHTILENIKNDCSWMETRLECKLLNEIYEHHQGEIDTELELENLGISFILSNQYKMLPENIKMNENIFHGISAGAANIIKATYNNQNTIKEIGINLINKLTDGGEKDQYVEILRDSALLLEKYDIHKAQQLMKIAHYLRPHGPLIISKLEEYENLLDTKLKIK